MTTTMEEPQTDSWAARWVQNCRPEDAPPMSELGKKVAEILAAVYRGIYNAPCKVSKVDWSDPNVIEVCVYGGISTYDSDQLTRLVVLCHDRHVRCEIEGAAPCYLRLKFSQRQREGGVWESHPTMEAAIARVRGA